MTEAIHMKYAGNPDEFWEIKMDGKAAGAISASLLDDMPEESVIQTMSNAAEVLGYCPSPISDKVCQKTGLVIGKVQSGKTSNFISLTALAFDNGYDVVVVLGGTKNVLVDQNKTRIEHYFHELAEQEIVILDTHNNRQLLSSEKIEQFVEIGKKVIIVVIKIPEQIKKIAEDVFNGSYLADKPTLIIDDEGDEASLNTLVKKNKKSSTYKAIEQLKNCLPRHCFVSVTATPQANILIDAIDVLSPDFGVLVNPGEGYCGLDVFHSDDTYIKTIPDDDDLQGPGVPESFEEALAMFFVACAIQKKRSGKKNTRMSMLVHESHLRDVHQEEYDKIMAVISQWRRSSTNKKDIAYIQDLRNKLKGAYDIYKNEGVKNIPDFDQIEDDIIFSIKACNAHIVNGPHASNSDDKNYNYNIYIGGALLGRGLTIKNLVITYITRTPKGKATVDTSEQRARWFGYKTEILDLCRVFMVKKLEREFMDIRDHEEDLWDTVRQAQIQGTHFKDIARIFLLSDNLRMTRTAVAKTSNFNFTYWNKQKIFQRDKDYASSNKTVLLDIKKAHENDLVVEQYGTGAPYTIWHSNFNEVKATILDKFIFPSSEPKLNKQVLKYLSKALEKNSLNPAMDVIWMRDKPGETSDHDIKDGDRIPNYSVGRRPKEANKPQVYAGDDKQFCTAGTMQLQIHMIRDNLTGDISPTFALYLPEDVVAKVTNLVYRP